MGQESSGFLRYMDQQGTVQHLTFSVQDFAAGVTSVVRGQLVRFHVLVDRRQQLQQAKQAGAGATAGTSSKHAFMRATQLRPLTSEEQVRPVDCCKTPYNLPYQPYKSLNILIDAACATGCK
jgi:hypothetical protein